MSLAPRYSHQRRAPRLGRLSCADGEEGARYRINNRARRRAGNTAVRRRYSCASEIISPACVLLPRERHHASRPAKPRAMASKSRSIILAEKASIGSSIRASRNVGLDRPRQSARRSRHRHISTRAGESSISIACTYAPGRESGARRG